MRNSRLTRNAPGGLLGVLVAGGVTAFAGAAFAQDLLGQPTPGPTMGLQPPGTEVAEAAHFFHNAILTPAIVLITLFVLGLMIYVAVRFNSKANPTPARFTHNTPVEVMWTIAPVLILLFIAIFSYKLLFQFNDIPRADLTVKVTGYQWYWGYEYPDQEIAEITSTMLPEDQARAAGRPFKLAVDNPMVVPQGAVVKVLITGADVIHSWGMPAFGYTFDAIPGRINETWFKADRVGTYYGNCRELCGADHAFMPVEVRVVPRAEFAAWVVRNGGVLGQRPASAASAAPPTVPGAAAGPQTTAPQPAAAAAGQIGTPAASTVPAAPVTPAAANPAAPNPAGGDPRPAGSVPTSPTPAAPAAAPAQ
ncbi:MAG: cytochrome c oxidase subunit II [Proteobacteria bacterium]|nr:cytochrome c oxidase subunit II [Pseudomonadota bacterium]